VPQPVLRLDCSSGDDRGVVNAVSRNKAERHLHLIGGEL